MKNKEAMFNMQPEYLPLPQLFCYTRVVQIVLLVLSNFFSSCVAWLLHQACHHIFTPDEPRQGILESGFPQCARIVT